MKLYIGFFRANIFLLILTISFLLLLYHFHQPPGPTHRDGEYPSMLFLCTYFCADSRGELKYTFITWILDERPSMRSPCMIFVSLKKNRSHYSLAADVEGLIEMHNKRHSCFLLSFCGLPAWKFRHIKLVAARWLCKLLTAFIVALHTWNLQCLMLSPTLKHTHRNFIIVAFTKILPTWIRL